MFTRNGATRGRPGQDLRPNDRRRRESHEGVLLCVGGSRRTSTSVFIWGMMDKIKEIDDTLNDRDRAI